MPPLKLHIIEQLIADHERIGIRRSRLEECRETFHFLSPLEQTRQTARLTKADITLLDKALACHTAPQPPALHSGPSDLQPLGTRARDGLGETLINSIFRTMEEAETVIERFQAPRNRDPLAQRGNRDAK